MKTRECSGHRAGKEAQGENGGELIHGGGYRTHGSRIEGDEAEKTREI